MDEQESPGERKENLYADEQVASGERKENLCADEQESSGNGTRIFGITKDCVLCGHGNEIYVIRTVAFVETCFFLRSPA